MGEAKLRKARDKFYGEMPKHGMGLVVSPPILINGNSITIESNSLNESLLRAHLLFWDRLVWPVSRAMHIGSGPNEQFLEDCGILKRPDYTVSGSGGRLLLQSQIAAFNDLNSKEPGQWGISQGDGSIKLLDDNFIDGRGTLIKLHNAIPVPDKEMPLNEILEFKERRRDELVSLRLELDKLYERILSATDSEHALVSALSMVEQSCADAIKVAKETKWPFRISDWELNFSLDPTALLSGSLVGLGAFMSGTPLNAAIMTGASLTVGRSFGRKQITNSTKPFRYVTSIHKEFI